MVNSLKTVWIQEQFGKFYLLDCLYKSISLNKSLLLIFYNGIEHINVNFTVAEKFLLHDSLKYWFSVCDFGGPSLKF